VNRSVGLTARHRLYQGGFAAITALGADRWLRPLTQGAGMILMFHHVRPRVAKEFEPNASLEITPEFLALTVETLHRQNVDIISLDDVPQRLSQGPLARPFAVLTFDDGYRDNIQYAAPVLRDLAAPWTLYVVDEFANGRGSLWWLDLERAISTSEELSVTFDDGVQKYLTRTVRQKHTAFRAIHRRLKAGPEQQLYGAMDELRRDLGFNPEKRVREYCADWSELRALAERHPNLTIGSHTLTHPILSRCDARKAEAEIAGSKDVIEARLGRPVRHISFPHGDVASAGAREFRLGRESGYETAVTTQPGHISKSSTTDLWCLPRVSINGFHQTENALKALLSGAAFLPLSVGRRS
jgi:peptidoglycan/xylan/chitin deacetylase (PgdA/CDA1 family)